MTQLTDRTITIIFGIIGTLMGLTSIILTFLAWQKKPQEFNAGVWRNRYKIVSVGALLLLAWGVRQGWFHWLASSIRITVWVALLIIAAAFSLIPAIVCLALYVQEKRRKPALTLTAQTVPTPAPKPVLTLAPQYQMFDAIWQLDRNSRYMSPPLCPKCLVAMSVWGQRTYKETWECVRCKHQVKWDKSTRHIEDEVTELALGELRRKQAGIDEPIHRTG